MAAPQTTVPPQPVVLFGYDSSPFTQKVRLALKFKRIPYTFVIVTSMMPRPVLRDNFNLTYRKIPVLAIGCDVYIDTSLILEVLEHQFPAAQGYGTIYPDPALRPIIRGFASYWTDRPFFRVTTGLIPPEVWQTRFGTDRANLIGHPLDAAKLARKVPENLAGLDTQLSLLEPLVADATGLWRPGNGGSGSGKKWLLGGTAPSAADIALFYQLEWGLLMARGQGIADLTGGSARDGVAGDGAAGVFNQTRYPGLWRWFGAVKAHVDALPSTETRVERGDVRGQNAVLATLAATRSQVAAAVPLPLPLLPTPAARVAELDARVGVRVGVEVSVAPDDTGRGSPTLGTLLASTPEEVVLRPVDVDGSPPRLGDVRIHFPRVGFVVRPTGGGGSGGGARL